MSFQHEDKEIEALSALSKAMSVFTEDDKPAIGRILAWFNNRYGYARPADTAITPRVYPAQGASSEPDGPLASEFNSPADLFDAAPPVLEYEKAIVVGYWFQIVEGNAGFNAQDVNSTLKNLGHQIKNITDSFSTAMERKPALVIQTQKTGSSKQARKLYKLTTTGIRWVENRLRSGGDSPDTGKEE